MKAKDNQSLFDVAVQYAGSADAALAFAMLNGMSVTDALATSIELGDVSVLEPEVASRFAQRGYVSATFGTEYSTHAPTDMVVVQKSAIPERTVKDNQSLFDVAVQYAGSADAALAFALLNGMSVTDAPAKGTALISPSVTAPKVAQSFSAMYDKGYVPGTYVSDTEPGGELALEGIGYWAIGIDFVVS